MDIITNRNPRKEIVAMSAVTLDFTPEQVIQLVEQLSESDQQAVYERLSQKSWARWLELTRRAEDKARLLASEQGLTWAELGESKREALRAEVRRRAAAKFLDDSKRLSELDLSPLKEEEIAAEIQAVREERKRKNASSGG
jgi:hypothetical protein